ncbi:MAG: glycosyltransferase family 9 protein [Synergistaceae bacterium]|nr:glycosyltransferase family 9 protein [Synergistaceae bacterium]
MKHIEEIDKLRPGDKVLFVRFAGVVGGLGDVLQDVSSIKALKDRFPNIQLTMLTAPLYAPLMERQPFIDKVITGSKNGLKNYLAAVKTVKENGPFDWLISMQGKSKSDTMGVLCGIPRNIGTGYKIFYDADLWKWFDFLDIAARERRAPTIFPPGDSIDFAKETLSGLPAKKVFAVIGGSWKSKMWPTDYWCEFLTELADEGWGIVLNGHGNYEEEIADIIVSHVDSSNLMNLVGKLDFYNMAGIASQCTISVGNDTGPLHLAALEGVPTLGIFGGTRPEDVGFLMPWFRCVYTLCRHAGCDHSIECERKFKHKCLDSVTPERVRVVFDQLAMLSNMNMIRKNM